RTGSSRDTLDPGFILENHRHTVERSKRQAILDHVVGLPGGSPGLISAHRAERVQFGFNGSKTGKRRLDHVNSRDFTADNAFPHLPGRGPDQLVHHFSCAAQCVGQCSAIGAAPLMTLECIIKWKSVNTPGIKLYKPHGPEPWD